MNFTKKIISVLLAVVLVIGTMSTVAFAWSGDGTQEARISVEPDKTAVGPGETVTFEIYLELDESGSWGTFGNFIFAFCYNNTVLTPVNTTWGPTVAEFAVAKQAALVTNVATIKSSSTAAEQAKWEADGINAMARIQCTKDNTSTYGSQGYWEPQSSKELLATVECVVSEDAAPGTAVCFDYYTGASAKNSFYMQTIDTSNNNRGTNRVSASFYDTEDAIVSKVVSVGSSGLTVADWKDQIRFDKNADGTYAGSFDFRTLAKIGNFDGVFDSVADAQGADDGDYIVDAGFVFNRGAAIDADAAKAQVESGNGSYSIVPNAYISTSYASGEYVMACLVTDIPDASKSDTLSCMGYVKYVVDGETMYAYGEVSTDTFNTLYGTYYSQAFGA